MALNYKIADRQFELNFDPASSGKARDEAMGRAEDYAHEEWKEVALEAVYQAALVNEKFIVDEVWGYLPEGVTTHDLRAMGPVMKRLQRAKVIEPPDEYRGSNKVTAHKVPRVGWRSLVCQQAMLL